MTRARIARSLLITSAILAPSLGCSPADASPNPSGPGGSNAMGQAGTGGTNASGGATTAGAATTGGATGGEATGGAATGGAATGGAATGGEAMGGAAMGGAAGSGGSATAGGGAGGASPGGASLSAGCNKMPTIASSMYNNGNPIAITAANRQRRYILSVPANYDNTKPYKLVIAWHQRDGNDKQMYQQNYYWIKSIAEAASSTIFVAPNGEKNGAPCTIAPKSTSQNSSAVVAQVAENFCIDKNKIFANGWSYGGSMSYRTACSRPLGGTGTWGVRAVAVYNGAAQLSGNCTPSKSVAFYASHGTNDNVLGYDGGVTMARTYATVNSCTWMTPTKATGNHVCTNVTGCMTGYPVEFCSFVGPHTPDPQEGGQRWQPQEVWKFFNQF